MDWKAAQQQMLSHEKAQGYMMKYIVGVNNQLLARALMLNSAMDKYLRFLDLKEADSGAGLIWDFAFTYISTVVPILRLTKYVNKVETGADVALAFAKLTGKSARAADVVSTGIKAGKVGAEIAKDANSAKEMAAKFGEIGEKAQFDEETAGSTELKKLDASRAPIKHFIEESRTLERAFAKAIDAEWEEYSNRLNGYKWYNQLSLYDYTKSLLPKPNIMTQDQLTEVENLYLWVMISEFAKKNVVIQNRKTNFVGFGMTTSGSMDISGLNRTQIALIEDWFGHGAKRGSYFYMPPLSRGSGIYTFLGMAGVKTITSVQNAPRSGRNAY